ncbi:hypothetical protein CA51_06400 [Rosistilla oblonga]|nr:hypothetical protein CA51_06400 [Rosistilla oblonga]
MDTCRKDTVGVEPLGDVPPAFIRLKPPLQRCWSRAFRRRPPAFIRLKPPLQRRWSRAFRRRPPVTVRLKPRLQRVCSRILLSPISWLLLSIRPLRRLAILDRIDRTLKAATAIDRPVIRNQRSGRERSLSPSDFPLLSFFSRIQRNNVYAIHAAVAARYVSDHPLV